MTFLQSVFLGVVEGFTEFLPISSTAHLILSGRLLGLEQTDFLTTFDIVIQLGAIFAVLVLYWRSFVRNRRILLRVIAAFIPTGIVGLLVHKIVQAFFFTHVEIILWSLGLGGISLIVFELLYTEKYARIHSLEHLPLPHAIGIGLFQSLAIIPGVSRAAATIVGGMLLGVSRQAIVDFSFLLAAPTMLAASSLELLKSKHLFTLHEYALLATGFLVSFFVALVCIRWFLSYIKHHSFLPFGVYRIALALLFWLSMTLS